MRKRRREARAKWNALVSEQKRSGQSVAAFCWERGVCAPQSCARKKQLLAHDRQPLKHGVRVHRVQSDANGALTALDLPPGEYVLCAEVPAAPFLDPCKWSPAPKLTIAAGVMDRPALVLKRGVFLKVRVNDPKGLLPPMKNDPSRAPNLIVGVVFGNGAFLAAANTRADQTGRDYQMSIPTGVPLKLWVFSRHVTLADAAGLPVDNSGGRIPFQAVAGQDQVFTLHVSGLDPKSP